MSIYWLDPDRPPLFPETAQALDDPNGLLAIGGALEPDWLTHAYQRGIFPWFSDQEPILWWSPSPRCVFRPGQIRITRRLRRRVRSLPGLRLTLHRDFEQVMHCCAHITRPDQPGTWITPDMQRAYLALHQRGQATAIGVWSEGALIGGLYGVILGKVLFGESMFSAQPDGSKIALAVVDWLARQGHLALLDAQVESAHLMRMGANLIPRIEFEDLLDRHCHQEATLKALPEELDLNAFLQNRAP